jgi:LPS sulfotransferase NodH
LAIGVLISSFANTILAGVQRLMFGRRLAKSELHGAPVFIIGHWRSGTTLLHELLVMDERLSSPSTFQCFAPHHFLVSEWFFSRFANWLLPRKRPMDNMAAGWQRPQEDEFALVNLGLPSPYRRIAFPNEGPVDVEYLNFQELSAEQIAPWMHQLRQFLLAVSCVTGRPLVIKSPTHTGRLAALAQAFPEAKFIHITRDPCALFPSTCRLWKSLDEIQAFQYPIHAEIESYVIECLQRMYAGFRQAAAGIEPSRFIEVRYEDLATSPVSTLQKIYDVLKLADFESVQPIIENWVRTEHAGYEANRHALPKDQEATIKKEWQSYFEMFGYQ